MNILILNWRDPQNPQAGGAEIVTMEHAKSWVKRGHSVTWYTSVYSGSLQEETINGVRIMRRPFVHISAFLYYLKNRKTIDFVIDEFHGISFFTPLYVRKPKVAFIHEVAGEIWDYMYPFPLNIIGKSVERVIFFLYTHVQFWTDARSTIDDLVRYGIPYEHCVAIPCPVINKPLRYIPKKSNPVIYICIARLVKMKGIERVLSAFVDIKSSIPDARLWIVGWGTKRYVNKLKLCVKHYKLSESVTFWGRVTEQKKLKLLQKAHVLLHAPVKEGWGLVVLEAASQGTPSVVYGVAGLSETVKNGVTGILVKQNTPKILASSAVELVSDRKRYAAMQKSALTWSKKFTWTSATRQSNELLMKVAR